MNNDGMITADITIDNTAAMIASFGVGRSFELSDGVWEMNSGREALGCDFAARMCISSFMIVIDSDRDTTTRRFVRSFAFLTPRAHATVFLLSAFFSSFLAFLSFHFFFNPISTPGLLANSCIVVPP